ncbi:MAG TPA: uroporphyrinogen decarboxylase [Candidatus Omnitrophota bacterium]|nr:uroporphyrinogen decarboxylase [Candidatus Omnitrophota bacterium]
MDKPLLLQAFEGVNKTVPVWFMRQAGRYLPEYQKIKQKYSLEEMFRTPDLACEITCQPVKALHVDAAILFADILTLPALMGVNVRFDNNNGPVIEQNVGVDSLRDLEHAEHVQETIRQIKGKLSRDIPLIGFAGSPFTVLAYLLEKKSFLTLHQTVKLIEENEEMYKKWMEKLTRNTIKYIHYQIEAGADVIQIFDTWAGTLRATDYAHWVLPYVQRIFEDISVPSIYYVKNCRHLLALMDKTKADFLSVCHTVVLGHHSVLEKTKKGIQGNLYNGLLYADPKRVEREVKDVLMGGKKHDRYIFNLNHGILPDVQPDQLKRIVEQVHRFPWTS